MRPTSLKKRSAWVLGAALLVTAAAGLWQARAGTAATRFEKPITIVVTFPPGGGTDLLARRLGERLQQHLGQPVVVDNRPGASGTIGSAYVAKAAPDGHTLLLAPSTFSIAPLVLKTGKQGPAYDVLNDLAPVIQVGVQPLFLVAGSGAGAKDFRQFMGVARQKGLQYGSPGSGSPMHILGEMFNKAAGVDIGHVPYRGVAPVITDVLGGHIPVTWMTLGPVAPYIANGKMTLLAVADAQRSKLAPSVPTLAELGVKDVEVGAWQGLFGPKGLPAPVVKTLNAHMNEILKMPDVVDRLQTLGIVPLGGDAARLAQTNAGDYQRFGKIIQAFNIQAD
jgi:tripartite-type tricarboxylate transporter receptor subunit TctC